MRSPQGSRSTRYRYFVLRSAGDDPEVARLNGHGVASAWQPRTQEWITDPLLAIEILHYDEWRPARAEELPAGVLPPDEVRRRSGWRRPRGSKGRHSDPAS